jgi:hypothetical protein
MTMSVDNTNTLVVNNVGLVKIEGPVWYTIYQGKQTPLLINQPMGKGHL